MKRWHLSLRLPQAKQRPKTEPIPVERAQARILARLHRYPAELIINMDETSWKQINNGRRTIAETGAESVNAYFAGEPKTCLTAITAIDAAGGKLPLWILARGTTPRCENRYRRHDAIQTAIDRGDLVLAHERKGWSNTAIIAQYLRWLRTRYGNRGRRPRRIALVWDIWTSHRCQDTRISPVCCRLNWSSSHQG